MLSFLFFAIITNAIIDSKEDYYILEAIMNEKMYTKNEVKELMANFVEEIAQFIRDNEFIEYEVLVGMAEGMLED